MRLVNVYRTKAAPEILYRLLAGRPKGVNISHRKMPSWGQHLSFVRSRPYKAWYLLRVPSGEFAGGIYLSKNDEIGVFIFKKHQKKGLGRQAVRLLMRRHRTIRRFLANVSPKNGRSIRFFRELKFRPIQNTYEFTR